MKVNLQRGGKTWDSKEASINKSEKCARSQKPFDGHVGCTIIKGDEIQAKIKETRYSMNINIDISQKMADYI